MRDFQKELVDKIAEEVLIARDYPKPTGKHGYDYEWDPTKEDSQYSMVREDVDYVTKRVFDFLRDDTPEEDEEVVESYGSPAVSTTNAIFIFVKNPEPGVPFYVKDVREWLNRVDMADIPDDTEVEGGLYLSYDLSQEEGDLVHIDRIECGDCGAKDILITNHSCSSTPI